MVDVEERQINKAKDHGLCVQAQYGSPCGVGERVTNFDKRCPACFRPTKFGGLLPVRSERVAINIDLFAVSPFASLAGKFKIQTQ